jgi:conjugative transfer signal peptidase TraF
MKTALHAFIAFGLLLVATAAGARFNGYIINITESMPIGVYLEINGAARRGDVVSTCIDDGNRVMHLAITRSYFLTGDCPNGLMPFLKTVAAVPGDLVQLTDDAVIVNGVAIPGTGLMQEDWIGRPLPRVARGSYVVGAGQVLLLATHSPASFDGRYFGLTHADQIRAVALPVALMD